MIDHSSQPIVLYDGVCGLCNRLVQFLLKRDRHDRLRFASLQSDFASTVLRRHNLDPHDLDTVHVVLDHGKPNERVLRRSDAVVHVVQRLDGFWKVAALGKLLPRWFRDGIYRLVATYRYQVFGKAESCILPSAKDRSKFIEV